MLRDAWEKDSGTVTEDDNVRAYKYGSWLLLAFGTHSAIATKRLCGD